ncbi:O-antigen ligase family protein [Tissierella sp.]|uniref:O-antigen ligase family protein n=1 Tax=Tissierella sp. TaxID=41274 RepID=UPI003F9A7A9A
MNNISFMNYGEFGEMKLENTTSRGAIEDRRISIAIMSSFAILTIQYLILIFFDLTGTSMGRIIQLTSKALVGFFYLIALPSVLKRNRNKFIAIYFISFYIFIINFIFFAQNRIYLKQIIFPLFFTGISSFIYSYSINDWEVLMDVMKKTSKIVFLVGSFISVLIFSGFSNVGSYSMSLSYYMLLPATVYINELFNKISLKNVFAAGVSLFVIVTLGSRGPILCLGVFIMLKLVKYLKRLTYNKMPLYLSLFAMVGTGLIFFKEILTFAFNFLMSIGIRSRSLLLFAEGGIYLSGRDNLYSDVFEQILNNPIFGLGLMGDRFILGNRYVHNIFMEILINFGMLIGLLFIVIITYLIIKSLFIKNAKKYNVIIIWLSLGFIHLMVSSTYLTDFKFWIFLGLICNALIKTNKFKECNTEKLV